MSQSQGQASEGGGCLQMTASMDKITGQMRVRFNRKPFHPDEQELLTALKGHGFGWQGFGEDGKWVADGHCIAAFEDRVFCARVKAAVKGPGGGLTFYDLGGNNVNLEAYISSVRNFDASAIDADLSSVGPSSVPPTPDASPKRPRQVRATPMRDIIAWTRSVRYQAAACIQAHWRGLAVRLSL